jgi:predicted transcriptional regulator
MIIIMILIDRVMELLQDSQWHDIEEIKKETSASEDILNEILNFLQGQGYIIRENKKLRIKSKGLRFLELPT